MLSEMPPTLLNLVFLLLCVFTDPLPRLIRFPVQYVTALFGETGNESDDLGEFVDIADTTSIMEARAATPKRGGTGANY